MTKRACGLVDAEFQTCDEVVMNWDHALSELIFPYMPNEAMYSANDRCIRSLFAPSYIETVRLKGISAWGNN